MLKSILKYGSIYCLIFVFTTGCPGDECIKGKDETDDNPKGDSRKEKPKKKVDLTPGNTKKKSVIESDNENSNGEDGELLLDQMSDQDIENEKENIDKEIEKNRFDIIEIFKTIEDLKIKIDAARKAILRSKHKWIFDKIKGCSLRPALYLLLSRSLKAAGLTDEEIKQIQSTEHIQKYLESLEKKLEEEKEKLQAKKNRISYLTALYGEINSSNDIDKRDENVAAIGG